MRLLTRWPNDWVRAACRACWRRKKSGFGLPGGRAVRAVHPAAGPVVGLAAAARIAIAVPVVAVNRAPEAADQVAQQRVLAVELPERPPAAVLPPAAVPLVAHVLVAGRMLALIDVAVAALGENDHAEIGPVALVGAAVDLLPVQDRLAVDELVRTGLRFAGDHPVLVGLPEHALGHVLQDDRVFRERFELLPETFDRRLAVAGRDREQGDRQNRPPESGHQTRTGRAFIAHAGLPGRMWVNW